jgi:hypothetical protein
LLLTVLTLAACTTADASSPAPRYDAIAFDINSWGRPLGSWEVHADGTVRHHQTEGSGFGAHQIEHRDFTIDSAAYAKLAAMAAQLPEPRLSREECKERATDLPYGSLRLARAGAEEEIRFDTGCLDPNYRRFVSQLQAMDELVDTWARSHPADRVEDIGN